MNLLLNMNLRRNILRIFLYNSLIQQIASLNQILIKHYFKVIIFKWTILIQIRFFVFAFQWYLDKYFAKNCSNFIKLRQFVGLL